MLRAYMESTVLMAVSVDQEDECDSWSDLSCENCESGEEEGELSGTSLEVQNVTTYSREAYRIMLQTAWQQAP